MLAQNPGGVYASAAAELRAGRKVGHWMWFVFPQLAGLLVGKTAEEICGSVDAMKLRSSMTLFARADPEGRLYQAVLDRYFRGLADEATNARLAKT